MSQKIGILVRVQSGLGVLHQLTGVIAGQHGNISSVEIIEENPLETRVYFEIDLPNSPVKLVEDLRALAVVREASVVKTLQKVYGRRAVILGGGAELGE